MWYSAVGCLVTLTLSLLAAPLPANAQPPAKVARIGYLSNVGGADSPLAEAFRQGLRELGYVEGHNIAMAFRTAEGHGDRLPALAAELVQLPVDVLVARSTDAAQAAKHASTTVPIVMVVDADPVATGLVASLARPGGNLTGLTTVATGLGSKRLELLKEAVPSLSRVAVLWNAGSDAMTLIFREIQTAARALDVSVQPVGVHEAKDLDNAFATMTEERADALFMITDVLTRPYTRQVVDFAAKRQLPTMFEGKDPVAAEGPVAAGGLMSYGSSLTDQLRRAASYVDRILKGTKPYDLPVEQPMTFQLVINLKAAQALGLTIPPTLLFQADEVIK
jgi:putative tryptophan/tyrosine transport system substrate-binding protein